MQSGVLKMLVGGCLEAYSFDQISDVLDSRGKLLPEVLQLERQFFAACQQ